MLQKLAKVGKSLQKLFALAYCCSQSRQPNAQNYILMHRPTSGCDVMLRRMWRDS